MCNYTSMNLILSAGRASVGCCCAAPGRRRLRPLRGGQRRRPCHFPPGTGTESVMWIRIRDTILETGDPARLPAQHAGR
jgi:hypothetical protein